MAIPFDAIWPADVVSLVCAICAASGRGNSQPPSESEILAMLSQSFTASLERDEGRDTAFTLAYCSPDGETEYSFERVLPLEPGILRRLAAATNPRRCWLCFGKRGEALGLIGMTIMPGSRSILVGFGGSLNFSVRVAGPGVLLASHTAIPLLSHRRGKTTVHRPGLPGFGGTPSPWAAIYSLPPTRMHDPQSETLQRLSVRYLVQAVAEHGHGGTLLVLPPDADWKSSASSSQFNPTKPCVEARDRLLEAVQEEPIVSKIASAITETVPGIKGGRIRENRIREDSVELQNALDWIAKLTATDGITVIESDLTLLAFGVMVQMQGREDLVIEEHTLFEPAQRKTLSQIGGARHQSAARACDALRGSVAFVASQDGELSSMRWDDKLGGVLLSRNLELLPH